MLPRRQIDAAFRANLEHMLARFGSKINLVGGFRKPYEARTIDELRRVLMPLYTVAITHHRPTPTIDSLADLVHVDVVRSILEYYENRFGTENSKSAHKYAHFLYVVAKYWVRLLDDDLKVLQRFRRNLKPEASGMADKNRNMLRLFEVEKRVDRLLTQGEYVLAQFAKIVSPSLRDAPALQLAFAIELLTAAPVRPQNLASICQSRHLVWGRDGTRETVHLIFPASEVKARPLLVDNGNDYLFPGQGPRHKGPGLLSQQIAETAQEVLGVRVTGHRFRHLVGFLYLKDNPGGHEVVRRFLGHTRIETTVDFCAGMEQAAAIAHLDRFIEDRRQRIVQGRSKRSPRARPGGPRRT